MLRECVRNNQWGAGLTAQNQRMMVWPLLISGDFDMMPTGRHPNRYGTFYPGWSILPQEITIVQILRKAGYATGHFGKWRLGPVKAPSTAFLGSGIRSVKEPQ